MWGFWGIRIPYKLLKNILAGCRNVGRCGTRCAPACTEDKATSVKVAPQCEGRENGTVVWPMKNAAGEDECHITHLCINGRYGQHACPAPKLMFDACLGKDVFGHCYRKYHNNKTFII